MCLIVVLGLNMGLMQKALFGLVSEFPAIYVNAFMVGQGCAGLIACVASMSSELANNGSGDILAQTSRDVQWSGFLYFAVGLTTVIVALVLFCLLEHTGVYRFFVHEKCRIVSEKSCSQEALGLEVSLEKGAAIPLERPTFSRVFPQIRL